MIPKDETAESQTPRLIALVLVLLCLLVVLGFLMLKFGSVPVSLDDLFRILSGQGDSGEGVYNIVVQYRLPRVVVGVFAGGALGCAGLLMQTLFRNPLADPYVLGISSGASLGVAILVLGAGLVGQVSFLAVDGIGSSVSIVVAASLGAIAVFALVLLASRIVDSNMALLILGILLGYVTRAVVSILMHFSRSEQVTGFVRWSFGDFSSVSWTQMPVFVGMIALGFVGSFLLVKPLNAFLLGETYAQSMGVRVQVVRVTVICSAAILTAAVTAFCGPIGFIGIAVPHLARTLFRTTDHRVLVPIVILAGAVLALAIDLVAQLPGSTSVLPLNAVTALVGAPVIVAVILRRRNLGGDF